MVVCRGFLKGAALICFLAAATGASAQNVIPAQYLAKLYTEALGRAPDQRGWTGYVAYFAKHGCSAATLQSVSATIYNSSEFAGDVSDAETSVIALYRGALNRDPDAASFSQYVSELESGTPLSQVVASVLTSTEFLGNVPKYCGSNPDYLYGSQPPLTPTPGPTGYTGNEAGLQALLFCAAENKCSSPVYLAQKAVIPLTTTLQVPSNITLTTVGNPPPQHYTQMGRLVRAASFLGPNVQVDAGGAVSNLWIDGQRNVLGVLGPSQYHVVSNVNVMTLGGLRTTVSQNKLIDPQGASNLIAQGAQSGTPCLSETISENLLTGYSTTHGYNTPADGMTVQCENADIQGNQLVDMTDEGILLEGSVIVDQASKVIGNTIVAAGNSINSPVSADPITGNVQPAAGQYVCYSGTIIENNVFWSSPYTSFVFGIEAGSRESFAVARDVDISCPFDGPGPIYKNNTTGTLSANVRAGIAIAGAQNVTVTNDSQHPLTFQYVQLPYQTSGWACPGGPVITEQVVGHASGTFPAATVNADFDFCIAPNHIVQF
jgi:hypothetical protein